MSRNGSGTYTRPNTFVAGTAITAEGHNQNWDDLESEVTNSVAADGQTTMSGPLKASNGSAAAPSVTFGVDTDTGVYRKAANELGFATAGTLAGHFDSSQKLWLAGAVDVAGAANFQTTLGVTGASTFTGAAAFNGGLTSTTGSFTDVLSLTTTSHLLLPKGTTAQRPSSQAAGRFRWNTTDTVVEVDDGSAWQTLVTGTQVASTAEVLGETAGLKLIRADRLSSSERVARAWGQLAGAGPSLQDSFGIATVVQNGTGQFTFTLSTAMANDAYAVAVTIKGSTGFVRIDTQTTTTFQVSTFSTSASLTTMNFSFVVFGSI